MTDLVLLHRLIKKKYPARCSKGNVECIQCYAVLQALQATHGRCNGKGARGGSPSHGKRVAAVVGNSNSIPFRHGTPFRRR